MKLTRRESFLLFVIGVITMILGVVVMEKFISGVIIVIAGSYIVGAAWGSEFKEEEQ